MFQPLTNPNGWTASDSVLLALSCVCAALQLVGARTDSSVFADDCRLTLFSPRETPKNHKCLRRWSLMCRFFENDSELIDQPALLADWYWFLNGQCCYLKRRYCFSPLNWLNAPVITRTNENQNCHIYRPRLYYCCVSAAGLRTCLECLFLCVCFTVSLRNKNYNMKKNFFLH